MIWALGTTATWLLPLPVEVGLYSSLLGLLALAGTRAPWTAAQRLVATSSALALLYVGQVVARGRATEHVSVALTASPSLVVLDLIRTPVPGAPWCWDMLVVAREGHDEHQAYVLRLGRATAFSGLSAERCPLMRPATTAPLQPVVDPVEHRVVWDGEYRIPLASFKPLAESCWGRAFLRFARAPFIAGERGVVGDLRFDRASEVEFTELEMPGPSSACPEWVPGWEMPRTDLLQGLEPSR